MLISSTVTPALFQWRSNNNSGVSKTIEMTEQLEISSPNDSENNRKRKRLTVLVLLIFLGSLCVVLSLMLILTFVLCLHCPDCDSNYKQGTSGSEEKFTTQQTLVHFIHLTDVNLDLKYNSSIPKRDMCRAANGSIKKAEFKAPLGRIGCDTPLLLLENSLEAIKNATEGTKLNFILISGKSLDIFLFHICHQNYAKTYRRRSDIEKHLTIKNWLKKYFLKNILGFIKNDDVSKLAKRPYQLKVKKYIYKLHSL